MRRSAAPSYKHSVSSCDNVSGINTQGPTIKAGQETFRKAPRSTASILKLIEENVEDAEQKKISEETNSNVSSRSFQTKLVNVNIPSGKQRVVSEASSENVKPNSTASQSPSPAFMRIFNVVWGKQSTKKHKTWEGDGILEVGEKGIVLKDTEGKVLGHGTRKKSVPLEEGSRLFIGSKEVEIIDVATEQTTAVSTNSNAPEKRTADTNLYQKPNPVKKTKLSSAFSIPVKGHLRHGMSYEPLVMPQPPHEHQWKYNTSCLPVTDVAVDPFLARVLRPHQREGMVFLYRCILGMHKSQFQGAILADEMGLGKTLQCIALVWTLLKTGPYGGHPILRKVLVVTPSSLVENWRNEFYSWLGKERINVFVVNQKNKPNDYKKCQREPVMLISYEMFLRCFDDISEINFDLLICDEGHRLKNSSIKISAFLTKLDCSRKILLTGTPIQNDLQEFYALINFVNPGVLASSSEFHQYFEKPILASRQPQADETTKKTGEERASELYSRTKWFILRRTQEVINKFLPTKEESVVFCKMSQIQEEFYKVAVSYWENRQEFLNTENVAHLSVITSLKKICNHPLLALDHTGKDEIENNVTTHLLQNCQTISDFSPSHSGKLSVLFSLLRQNASTMERVVIVSYFTQTLDMMAILCEKENYKYCRLDGSTPLAQRQKIVDLFNNLYSPYSIFLLSARAGGVGLNLIGGSRLVLFDSDWNPATDLQAMSRIWRDGQRKHVHIYRLLTTGSIEEKIYQRQLNKTALGDGIVDAQNISSIKLSNEDIKDLFRIHKGVNCVTHNLLKCDCKGEGEAPGSPQNSDCEDVGKYENDELSLFKGPQQNKSLKLQMNELFHWEHHVPPFNAGILEGMGLKSAADTITYIFRNVTVMKEDSAKVQHVP